MSKINHLPSKWLIATDGSPYATMSVEYAARLYKHLNPKPDVILLNVIKDPRSLRREQSDLSSEERNKSRQVLVDARDIFLKEAGSDDTVSTLAIIGEPRQVIVEIAKVKEIDHVIMGDLIINGK